MHDDSRDTLSGWLGRDARVLDELSDQQVEDLHAAVVDARKRQAEALRTASEQALRQIPTFLRRGIETIMGN